MFGKARKRMAMAKQGMKGKIVKAEKSEEDADIAKCRADLKKFKPTFSEINRLTRQIYLLPSAVAAGIVNPGEDFLSVRVAAALSKKDDYKVQHAAYDTAVGALNQAREKEQNTDNAEAELAKVQEKFEEAKAALKEITSDLNHDKQSVYESVLRFACNILRDGGLCTWGAVTDASGSTATATPATPAAAPAYGDSSDDDDDDEKTEAKKESPVPAADSDSDSDADDEMKVEKEKKAASTTPAATAEFSSDDEDDTPPPETVPAENVSSFLGEDKKEEAVVVSDSSDDEQEEVKKVEAEAEPEPPVVPPAVSDTSDDEEEEVKEVKEVKEEKPKVPETAPIPETPPSDSDSDSD